jgi:hypothetical protein
VLSPDLKPFVREEAGRVKADMPKPGKNDDAALVDETFVTWFAFQHGVAFGLIPAVYQHIAYRQYIWNVYTCAHQRVLL